MNNQSMQKIQLPDLPDDLLNLGNKHWQDLISHSAFNSKLTEHKELIICAFSLSEFISEQCIHRPHWLVELIINRQLFAESVDFESQLKKAIDTVQSEQVLMQKLRQFRNFHMLRIAWRDLTNLQSIDVSLSQVSELAQQLIIQANDWLYKFLLPRYGEPKGEFGLQPMLIMGMGKLGGSELNFSSDIDLIFTYPAQGETLNGRKSIEHQQFFTKLAQKLIAALNQITADGQVYRVDMRLRPFGDSGPLVMHFDAMEDYYQEQGRDWERYAMLKSRILNPPSPYTELLSGILRPFIYRRYLDFNAIESLRNMKSMIQQEVRRRGLSNNIKLGQGGIREAEFIVQSLQLINGGREKSLQTQSLQSALSTLEELQILPAESAKNLRNSYLWLRKVEHCLQQFADKQTQILPDKSLDQLRLIQILNIQSYEDFLAALQHHCSIIHEQFSLLVKDEESQPKDAIDDCQQAANDLWHLDLDISEATKLLNQWLPKEQDGTESATQEFYQLLINFKANLVKKRIGQRGLTTINSLMPIVLKLIFSSLSDNSPVELLARILSVLHSILGRTAYLQLLFENQGALFHLVKLCGESPWVAEQIGRFPLLLDELLNPATLYDPVAPQHYVDELRQVLLRIEPEDLELQIETLRQFKLSQQLKIAAADISKALHVMKVSDQLTYLAEAIISQVVDLAWQQITAKHGVPVCQDHGPKSEIDKGFAILGFGKLGGWELGYGSDLDLVFVHNCNGNNLTNGNKSIESRSFYLKLAQRILHIFTIKTGLGLLYEVDMRLRPSGNAGLLVCHINGFAYYQEEDAWTWEHQALCRARFIDGGDDLRQSFDSLRLAILSRPRDLSDLAKQVVDMREKMRTHLSISDTEKVDLKQDSGGIADIEFMVQFMLLAHTKTYPALAKWTDNVRVLKELTNLGIMTVPETNSLAEAYLEYRNYSHQIALQKGKFAKASETLTQHQGAVKKIWTKYLTQVRVI